jgi:hypothetical protein
LQEIKLAALPDRKAVNPSSVTSTLPSSEVASFAKVSKLDVAKTERLKSVSPDPADSNEDDETYAYAEEESGRNAAVLTVGLVSRKRFMTCPRGWYSATKEKPCTRCAAGHYATTAGRTFCTNCAAGYYATTTKNWRCTECPASKYSTSVGSSLESSCISCAVGYYGASPASIVCDICTPGQF